MKKMFALGLVASLAFLTACSGAETSQEDANPKEVKLLAYDAFTPEKGIFDDFTAATGATVKVITAGDTGTMVSKAILTAGSPEADVMWGVDNTLLSRAQNADLLNSYEPVDEGDVCVNYDKKWFSSQKLAVPTTLEQLAETAYKNLLVVQDPVASSPGLAFLLGTIAHFGETVGRTTGRNSLQMAFISHLIGPLTTPLKSQLLGAITPWWCHTDRAHLLKCFMQVIGKWRHPPE